MLSAKRFLLSLVILLLLAFLNRVHGANKVVDARFNLKGVIEDHEQAAAVVEDHTTLMGKIFPILTSMFGR